MIKVQHIETDPLAPDTIEEVLGALERIIELTGRTLGLESYQKAKDYLHQNPSQDLVLDDPQLQSKYGGKVVKAVSGYSTIIPSEILIEKIPIIDLPSIVYRPLVHITSPST